MVCERAVAAKRFGQRLYVRDAHMDAGVLTVTGFAGQVVVINHVDGNVCLAADLLHKR